jgi:two-component system chemotaxis response regulator CheY
MRALVVDDSRTMRRIVSGILEGLRFGVRQAEHGAEGLQLLREGYVPDLACVDWNMPVMDGLEFVQAVRAEPAWRSVKLLMLTSQVEFDQVVRALDAGAEEYLMKPFTAEAVRAKLALLSLLPAEASS